MNENLRPKPKNGWLVVCFARQIYTICGNEDMLAREVDRIYHLLDKEPDFPLHPAQAITIYELGERVSVATEPKINRIRLVES